MTSLASLKIAYRWLSGCPRGIVQKTKLANGKPSAKLVHFSMLGIVIFLFKNPDTLSKAFKKKFAAIFGLLHEKIEWAN